MFSVLCELTVGKAIYTIKLGAGLGLVDETKHLLEIWKPGMSNADLIQTALTSGAFPNITARRLKNIVTECFAPRYLVGESTAPLLKKLMHRISPSDFSQLLFIHTARANRILADFVRQIYWPRYSASQLCLSNEEAKDWVTRAVDDGKSLKPWTQSTIRNMAGYLTGCCADYGMLERGRKTSRKFLPFRISAFTAAYLAYDLHFRGLGDNTLLGHEDFQLFGLSREDVLEEFKNLGLQGHLIMQIAGDVVRIGWKYPDMEALCNVFA